MKQNLVAVEAGTLVVDAAKVMMCHNVGSVFVSQKGSIVGLVTESDVVKKFEQITVRDFLKPVAIDEL